MGGHRLVQAMRQAGETPQNEVVDLVVGEVTSISPLRVKIENRELTQSFLILGALCKEAHIDASKLLDLQHTHEVPATRTELDGYRTDLYHTHEIKSRLTSQQVSLKSSIDIVLWRGLIVGDKVMMLKVGKGQKYFILQRLEGIV